MTDIGQTPATEQPQGDGGNAGTESLGNTPWDLSSAPEELRPYLAQELKRIEGGITPKLQEAAELRKQFGHLAEMEGFSDVPQEELQELLQFRQMVQDPEQFEQWWSSIGEELGFFAGDDDAGDDGDYDSAASTVPPEVEQTLQQMQEQMQQLQQALAQQQGQTAEQQALQKIESDLSTLKEQHGEFDEDAVCSLAMAYDNDPDAIMKGFADYQRITGKAQTALVEGKEATPGGRPLSGGGADTSPEPVNGFGEARSLALARMKGA